MLYRQRFRLAAPSRDSVRAMAPPKKASAPRYSIWNNKGGVGKTFLCFIVAAEYAEQHPERQVVVVDMCPQANVSEIMLGGNGAGADELDKLLGASPRMSVGGYFVSVQAPSFHYVTNHTRVGIDARPRS